MKDIQIFEKELGKLGEKICKIAIFRGGLNEENPTSLLNDAVREYVGRKGHNQFVEIHLDNPWIRIVIEDINMLKFEDFTDQRM